MAPAHPRGGCSFVGGEVRAEQLVKGCGTVVLGCVG